MSLKRADGRIRKKEFEASRFSQPCGKSVLAIFLAKRRAGKSILATVEKGVTEMRNFRIGLMVILGVLATATAWADKGDRNDRSDRQAWEDNRHRDHRDDKGDNDRDAFSPVPQTGQVLCWDSDGVEIFCRGTGQDGALQEGVAIPTPRFTDKKDGTIKDNLTGLIWLKNANCPGSTLDWQGALDFVAGINDGTNNCGDSSGKSGSHRTDWRLPNIRELYSLIDFAFVFPALSNAAGTGQGSENDPFLNLQITRLYWSSTTYQGNPKILAWVVDVVDGLVVGIGKKGVDGFVLAVRGGS
jgi:Protein of unknown function (DUF1566)